MKAYIVGYNPIKDKGYLNFVVITPKSTSVVGDTIGCYFSKEEKVVGEEVNLAYRKNDKNEYKLYERRK